MKKSQPLSESKKGGMQRRVGRVRKCNLQWTSEAIIVLIRNVAKLENLWNPSSYSYKDRKMHQKSWDKISKSLSLPKQEVVVKWNSLRSNYRNYLKNLRGREGIQRYPHRIFLEMAFLDPVLKIDEKKPELNLSEDKITENTNSAAPRSSGVSTDVGNTIIDTTNIDLSSANISEIKDETSSLMSEDNLPAVSQLEEDFQRESWSPMLSCENVSNKRKIQELDKKRDENEEAEENLESLKKTKLRLEIYNLQLDALKKEIELDIERSEFTKELYTNWDVYIKEEI